MISKKLFVMVSLLVLGDVITTHVNQIIFGKYFGELGLIANFFMRTYGEFWLLAMYPVELAIFGLTTFVFSKSNNAFHISTKKLSLAYLPVMTLALLIGNNLIQILIFTSRPF